MALTAETPLFGSDLPRLGVDIDPAPVLELRKHGKALGIESMPWQDYVLALAEATNPDGSFLFEEIAAIVARQNGKSTMLAPLIRKRMAAGRRVLHSAQDRIIPRRIFERVAESFRGEARIRLANGQEEVALPNGGRYKIVAPKRGIRGNDADDLILDEIQEQEDFDFVDNDAKPTTTASDNRQIIYLGNAGSELSVVLNSIKERSGKDPILAYLEWSADTELHHGDHAAWAQANPALGRTISLARLETIYRSYLLGGNLEAWETQHLCRWVVSMLPRLVNPQKWSEALRATESPLNPFLGISVAPDGTRASAALSWAQGDGSIGLKVLADVTGDPIDLDLLAADLKPLAVDAGVMDVAFDPWTDKHLARHFTKATPISGQDFANASERFVRVVETGQLRHRDSDAVTNDLPYTSRKSTSGAAFVAERANPRRPITAALAAIRAVWLAASPNQGPPSVY